jgi:hypothetical protein
VQNEADYLYLTMKMLRVELFMVSRVFSLLILCRRVGSLSCLFWCCSKNTLILYLEVVNLICELREG